MFCLGGGEKTALTVVPTEGDSHGLSRDDDPFCRGTSVRCGAPVEKVRQAIICCEVWPHGREASPTESVSAVGAVGRPRIFDYRNPADTATAVDLSGKEVPQRRQLMDDKDRESADHNHADNDRCGIQKWFYLLVGDPERSR